MVQLHQRSLDEWLEVRFLTGVCAADVWPDHSEINRQVQKWTMTRVAVDAATSIRLLQEKWWLPARSPIPGRDGDDTGHAKATMRACRYLNRRVSHFFQRIGDRVSAAYTMKLLRAVSHAYRPLDGLDRTCLPASTSGRL